MKTIPKIQEDWDRALAEEADRHKEELRNINETFESELFEAASFGGFLDRPELAVYLGISMPRISVLIRDGRIREGQHGCSLADAKAYRDTRKPGRPSWSEKKRQLDNG